MKIGIDTLGCNHAKSGFGAYVMYFISNLPVDCDHTIELFGSEIDRYTYTSEKDINFQSVPIQDKLAKERKWHKRKVNKFVKKNKYDVVIYPAITNVIPSKFKNHLGIIIVNSVLSVVLQKEKGSYKRQLTKGFKNCHKIIAASEFIKDDLIKLGASEDKITVIHNGIDHKLFFPMIEFSTSDTVTISPFSIKRPYFIYGSSLSSPDKKHIELIKAFELFKDKTAAPHRLVLAGANGDYADAIHEYAFNSKYASDIVLTGFFAYDNIAKLYAGAEACCFPPINEGVGLPLLEAMACGVPVISSNSGALQEAGGTSAIYFDSNNIEEIASCMERIINDKDLREKMVFDGLIWAGEFNWETTVKRTLKLIDNK